LRPRARPPWLSPSQRLAQSSASRDPRGFFRLIFEEHRRLRLNQSLETAIDLQALVATAISSLPEEDHQLQAMGLLYQADELLAEHAFREARNRLHEADRHLECGEKDTELHALAAQVWARYWSAVGAHERATVLLAGTVEELHQNLRLKERWVEVGIENATLFRLVGAPEMTRNLLLAILKTVEDQLTPCPKLELEARVGLALCELDLCDRELLYKPGEEIDYEPVRQHLPRIGRLSQRCEEPRFRALKDYLTLKIDRYHRPGKAMAAGRRAVTGFEQWGPRYQAGFAVYELLRMIDPQKQRREFQALSTDLFRRLEDSERLRQQLTREIRGLQDCGNRLGIMAASGIKGDPELAHRRNFLPPVELVEHLGLPQKLGLPWEQGVSGRKQPVPHQVGEMLRRLVL
jgi:hypothetical protein